VKLLRLYNISEAGVSNRRADVPGAKKRRPFRHANGGGMTSADDDDDELGPEADYDDPSPPDEPSRPEPARPAKPFKEPERQQPFAGQSAKPSPAMQGGKTAGTLSADRETLGALERALEHIRTGDDDLQSWVDDLLSEIGRALRSGGDVKLPKFVAASDSEDGDEDQEDED
jgi:hypothetical protein